MLRRKYTKVAAIVFACLALSGTAVYASRGLTWYGSGTPGEYTSYQDINKAFQKSGIDASVPEELLYGFTFKEASINTFGQMDGGNKKVSEYTGLDVCYENADGQQIMIAIEPVVADGSDEEPIAAKELSKGVTATYDCHEMLMVPSRDEISKEDRERELTDPKFWISEGSKQIERTTNSNVRFEIDGISYNILGFDLNLTQDEMFALAKTVADWNL